MKLVITTVVTLTINDNIKFLENMRQRFKITIYWNKYRSEIAIQRKNNNLDYLIDPSFRNINRTFVVSFKNGNSDTMRDSFNKYYMPLVEIKDFNALIDNKPFLHQPVKNKQEVSHPETRRRRDVVTTSLCMPHRRRRYVSNETPNDVSVERR